jgi:hypothetical protein
MATLIATIGTTTLEAMIHAEITFIMEGIAKSGVPLTLEDLEGKLQGRCRGVIGHLCKEAVEELRKELLELQPTHIN